MQMKYLRLLCIAMFVARAVCAQSVYVGVFAGASAYSGDLTSTSFLPKKVTKPAVGITANIDISSHFTLRSGLYYGTVGGADRYADDPSRVSRNLSFETRLIELSTFGEVYLLDLDSWSFSPYGFVGMALFHFNSYTFDTKGQRVYLKPLSTEGQGLNAYPERKPYHLLQFSIPYGGGIKFKLNEQIRIGFEVGLRKLFTEYIDDVSTQYVDYAALMNAKGSQAVELAYRGDELDQGIGNSILPYPSAGTLRGDPSKKDTYYFTGMHVSYFFNSRERGGGSYNNYGRKHAKMGCPTNVY
jgi:hypothetical protein